MWIGEENGNPLQYSCWENPMGREALQAIVWIAKSQTLLSTHTHTHTECDLQWRRMLSIEELGVESED